MTCIIRGGGPTFGPEDHSQKMRKGVKVFTFKEGDMVLRRNMVKAHTKGLFTVVYVCFITYL